MVEKKKREKKVRSIDLYQQELQMYLQMPDQIRVIKGWTQKELDQAIADLTEKVTLSKRGKSSRIKGATYENTIAKKIGAKWGITLVRTPMSGGFQKSSDNEDIRGDLSCLDKNTKFILSPELKKQKTWKLREWFRQSKEDAPVGKIPIVVFHDFKVIKEGKVVNKAEDYVMIKLEDFLEITTQDKVIIKTEEKKGMKRDVPRKVIKSKGIKRK